MREQIKKYIEEKLELITTPEDSIDLYGVSPSDIEDVLGNFEDLDINGWQGDYWGGTEDYSVSGSMYYGSACITKK